MGGDVIPDLRWEPTPWWNIHRWFGFAWRAFVDHSPWDHYWCYQTTRQRAHKALEERYGATRASNTQGI